MSSFFLLFLSLSAFSISNASPWLSIGKASYLLLSVYMFWSELRPLTTVIFLENLLNCIFQSEKSSASSHDVRKFTPWSLIQEVLYRFPTAFQTLPPALPEYVYAFCQTSKSAVCVLCTLSLSHSHVFDHAVLLWVSSPSAYWLKSFPSKRLHFIAPHPASKLHLISISKVTFFLTNMRPFVPLLQHLLYSDLHWI